MSIRLLFGLMVGAAILVLPAVNMLLLRMIPAPDVIVRVGEAAHARRADGELPCPPWQCAPGIAPGSAPNDARPALKWPPMRPDFGPGHEATRGFPVVGFAGSPEFGKIRRHFMWINLLSVLLVMGVAGLLFSLVLRAPFRGLLAAIADIERGASPPVWAFSGPREIRSIGQALTRLGAQLRSNLQEREMMLAGLSHDLRSPLARVQAAIELRAQDEQDWADTLVDIQLIDHIIGQCIDYARDGQDEPLQSCSLDQVVITALGQRLPAGVELQLQAPDPLMLRPQSLARAVRNLVDNACLHGAPPVRVRTRQLQETVVLSVEDQGGGIDARLWARLLQPFVQGGRARNPGGAGLGLAITQRVADRHGGHLWLRARSNDQAFAVELHLPRG